VHVLWDFGFSVTEYFKNQRFLRVRKSCLKKVKVAVEDDGKKPDADYAEKQERKTLHLLTFHKRQTTHCLILICSEIYLFET